MGTYRSIRIDVNTNTQDELEQVKQELINDNDGGENIIDFCFRKFSPSVKWFPNDLAIRVSKKFPNLTFRVTCYGSEPSANSDVFFQNGEGFNVNFVLPFKFPTKAQWKDAQKRYKLLKEQEEIKNKQKAKEQEEQKIKMLADEIEKKQKELNELKKSIVL